MGLAETRPLLRAGLVAALTLSIGACGEEIVVRQETRVYPDTSIHRTVRIAGRTGKGETPAKPGWLAEDAGVLLAAPSAWSLVDERPGDLEVEGNFTEPAAVPATLSHHTDTGIVVDRSGVRVEREDLIVLTRWVYEETLGDPMGVADLEASLDGLLDMAVSSVREELARQFGESVDPAPVEAFLSGEARPLAGEIMTILKRWPGPDAIGVRARGIAETLDRRGVRPVPGLQDAEEWSDALEILLDPLLEWTRERTAGTLSSVDEKIEPDDLSFWPTGDELIEVLEDEEDAPDARTERFRSLIWSLLQSVEGYYGDLSSPRFRFEIRLEMPGRLIRTDGTPTREGVLWLLRNADLGGRLAVLRAESVELNVEALVALGARRDFDPAALLRLTDILAHRDPEAKLGELLARAVHQGRLDLLGDEDAIPEDLEIEARELWELLDPSGPAWPER